MLNGASVPVGRREMNKITKDPADLAEVKARSDPVNNLVLIFDQLYARLRAYLNQPITVKLLYRHSQSQ